MPPLASSLPTEVPNTGRPLVPKIGSYRWPLETQASETSQQRLWQISQYQERPHFQHSIQPNQMHG